MNKHPEGARLAALMSDAGYNQAQVARVTGINPTTLNRIVRGHVGIGTQTAQRLRGLLGPQVEDIVAPTVALSLGWKELAS